MKKWNIGNPNASDSETLAAKSGLPNLCADVLVARGINTYEKASEFFGCNENSHNITLSDPFLLKDMKQAAEFILNSVEEGKKICIYGDYDCDGITSTAVLFRYLEWTGADVIYHINLRSQGYGMCEEAVRKLADEGVEVIITVDNGISAVKEAELCFELGIDLIITDHHQPPEELPVAAAIINPHQRDDVSPFKDLCGCGVVLKLIAAMDGGDYYTCIEQFSDVAAIATIADVVPLKGENREIVRLGLHYLENTENLGLKALIECAGIKGKINSTDAAFKISPRINASGRFGSASDACKLLLCDDPDEAEEIAKHINSMNNERKNTESEIIADINRIITENPSVLHKRVIVIYQKGWHHGVIGIICSRLVERFGKPVFIMSDDEGFARGSARSVPGFNIHSALTHCSDLLAKFGGHSGAGGFSLLLENITAFDIAIQKYAVSYHSVMPQLSINAEKIISPDELNPETIKSLEILEPFGEGNKQPLFAMIGVRLLEVISLSGGNHTKLKLTYGQTGLYGLLFNTKTSEFPYKSGDILDMLVYPEINNYKDNLSVNVKIADYRLNGLSQTKIFAAKNAYEQYARGEGADSRLICRMIPERDELISIYKAVPKTTFVSCDSVYSRLDTEKINYCKFRLSLDIFDELELFLVDKFNDSVRLSDTQKKVQLENSDILNRLIKLKNNT